MDQEHDSCGYEPACQAMNRCLKSQIMQTISHQSNIKITWKSEVKIKISNSELSTRDMSKSRLCIVSIANDDGIEDLIAGGPIGIS